MLATITLVDPTHPTHLWGWPTGTNRPPTSLLNAPAGATRANLALIPLAPDGTLQLQTNTGTTHAIIDILGYTD